MYSLIFSVLILLSARVFNMGSLLVGSKIGFVFSFVVVSCGMLLYYLFFATILIAFLLYLAKEVIELMFPKKNRS